MPGVLKTCIRHYARCCEMGVGVAPGTDPAKPNKPTPDFPLFAHANGQWARKRKLHHYGLWGNALGSLSRYLAEVKPPSLPPNSVPDKPSKPHPNYPLYSNKSGGSCLAHVAPTAYCPLRSKPHRRQRFIHGPLRPTVPRRLAVPDGLELPDPICLDRRTLDRRIAKLPAISPVAKQSGLQ